MKTILLWYKTNICFLCKDKMPSCTRRTCPSCTGRTFCLLQDEHFLLVQETSFLLVQEQHILFAQEEIIRLVRANCVSCTRRTFVFCSGSPTRRFAFNWFGPQAGGSNLYAEPVSPVRRFALLCKWETDMVL